MKQRRRIMLAIAVLFTLSIAVVHAGTSDMGYYLQAQTNLIGLQADVSSMSTMTVTQGNPTRNIDIFAVTLLTPGDACLEVAVRVASYPGYQNGATIHELGAYDSCNSRFQWYFTELTSTNLAKYERTLSYTGIHGGSYNDKTMKVKAWRNNPTGNCWSASVWNYNTSAWDAIGSTTTGYATNRCGTDDRSYTYSWDMFETYGLTQASSVNMCTQLGTYGFAQAANQKLLWSDGSSTTLDYHAFYPPQYFVNDDNGCFNPAHWQWSTNYQDTPESGGDHWAVCDDIGTHYQFCEGT